LRVYLEDGRVPIDNNWTENVIWPVAIVASDGQRPSAWQTKDIKFVLGLGTGSVKIAHTKLWKRFAISVAQPSLWGAPGSSAPTASPAR
ncbi:hypothetical protein, partial [Serratia symbiotica]|uniref:hypothetical protein n=1 Tax=Serratia symbiotica TaxID=138074 RepID=UPI001E5BF615